VAPLASMPSNNAKITTPTPSLNSDSPAMTSSSSLGTPAERRIPITAIGSVGEISAPNSRQWTRGSGSPASGSASHMPKPTISVDTTVPSTASNATGQRYEASARRST
jgi:hypothetical protein